MVSSLRNVIRTLTTQINTFGHYIIATLHCNIQPMICSLHFMHRENISKRCNDLSRSIQEVQDIDRACSANGRIETASRRQNSGIVLPLFLELFLILLLVYVEYALTHPSLTAQGVQNISSKEYLSTQIST